MKKVLLATTALALSAGVASAEVSLSGSARMGMDYLESRASDKIQAAYRTRINLTGSAETDSGLSFSATIRLQDATTAATTNAIGVTVSGAFGSLTFGSSSSAAELAVGDIAGVGYGIIGSEGTTSINDAALIVYSYTAGSLTVMASAGQLGTDDFSLGGSYSANGLTVAAGYEDNGTSKATSASVAYAMGDTTVKAVWMDNEEIAGGDNQIGASVKHAMGAISMSAYYQTTDTAAADDVDYGVGAAYDLGGGAAIKGGFASTDGNTTADLGMTFSF
jgi:outer membrane protein OmpU